MARTTTAIPRRCTYGKLSAAACHPGMTDPFVDCVDRTGSALEQRREDHRLEENVKQRNADALEKEVRGERRALHLRVECDHRDEEEQRGKHRQRSRDRACNHRIAIAHEMAKDRQDHDCADDIVSEIGEP